jgi:hypothetical protein
MYHTFLFEEGHWTACGVFLDNQNNQLSATAEMLTVHQDNIWFHESVVCLNTEQPTEFVSCGQIIPFAEREKTTVWKSSNSILGILEGKFILVSNAIISNYRSQDDFYRGTECFIKLDSNCYENKGFLFTNNDKVSSWSMRLNRTLKTKI